MELLDLTLVEPVGARLFPEVLAEHAASQAGDWHLSCLWACTWCGGQHAVRDSWMVALQRHADGGVFAVVVSDSCGQEVAC